jgi:hypothetical protein
MMVVVTREKSQQRSIEMYDPVRDEWSDWVTPLNVTLGGHRAFSVILSGV